MGVHRDTRAAQARLWYDMIGRGRGRQIDVTSARETSHPGPFLLILQLFRRLVTRRRQATMSLVVEYVARNAGELRPS
jgi:hypothetical protein